MSMSSQDAWGGMVTRDRHFGDAETLASLKFEGRGSEAGTDDIIWTDRRCLEFALAWDKHSRALGTHAQIKVTAAKQVGVKVRNRPHHHQNAGCERATGTRGWPIRGGQLIDAPRGGGCRGQMACTFSRGQRREFGQRRQSRESSQRGFGKAQGEWDNAIEEVPSVRWSSKSEGRPIPVRHLCDVRAGVDGSAEDQIRLFICGVLNLRPTERHYQEVGNVTREVSSIRQAGNYGGIDGDRKRGYQELFDATQDLDTKNGMSPSKKDGQAVAETVESRKQRRRCCGITSYPTRIRHMHNEVGNCRPSKVRVEVVIDASNQKEKAQFRHSRRWQHSRLKTDRREQCNVPKSSELTMDHDTKAV
ncbi:hypothetical protein NEOLEDRAFT_1170241 [Neolentinus lepideus HHB14362 ss-1]|uniref:Uncharacterized protein n=1 Tax=Neolentinus lepideus HHB14362 ss-1 TaxID=1314782 RepID=A0A165RR32_9AGAM|nr:hypothetical protein NEOLEDRAFT_1170241 [Neolentinus lepideus HHB14362 ss-1]